MLSALESMDNFVQTTKDPVTKRPVTVDTRPMVYQTSASYNAAKNEGVITLTLHIRNELFNPITDTATAKLRSSATVATVIGLWFGVFPFKLAEIFPHTVARLDRKKVPVHSE